MSDVYRTAPVPTLDETYLIGRHHGERAERERIIKLMEKEVQHDFPPIIEMSLDSFIKLIKGDDK